MYEVYDEGKERGDDGDLLFPSFLAVLWFSFSASLMRLLCYI